MNTFQNILPYGKFGSSRAINAENPMGEKGKGGMAASGLGIGKEAHVCKIYSQTVLLYWQIFPVVE